MDYQLFISAYITCPGSYLCDKVPNVNISKCVTKEEVCDGSIGCPGGDDETKCSMYIHLYIICSDPLNGWMVVEKQV